MTVHDAPALVHGRTWEEMPVGFAFRTSARTITEADLVAFVTLAGLTEPLFLDARSAADEGYGGRLVPATLTLSYAEGLVLQTGCAHGTGIAFLGAGVDVKGPVFVGDTITVLVEVTGQRPTSKGDRGVVTTRNTVHNQRGEVVLEYSPSRLTKGR